MVGTNREYRIGYGCVVLLFVLLSGCASNGDYRDPRDPLESYNRVMYRVNDTLDRGLIKPLARGYTAITPAPVNRGITNFFGNLADVTSAINNVLQFKLQRAASDVGRVVFNTTIGLLGFIDVASNMNLPKYGEDFGQTLGVWGFGPGPYIVLPLLGPSSTRDTVGVVVGWFTDPVRYVRKERIRYGLVALRLIDKRASLLGASRVMDEAALDPYQFMRDAYLQKRRHEVYDGNPPPEPFDDEFDDEFGEDFDDEFDQSIEQELNEESSH